MIKNILLVFLCSIIGCSTKSPAHINSQKIENLETFAKIYGYVKYFHPSDEAYQLDWNKFSIYAVNKILELKSNESFVKTIDSLFSPIAPSIEFTDSKIDTIILEKSDSSNVYSEQFWYHQGVGFGMSMENGPYFSQHIIANPENDSISYRPHFGETISVELNENNYLSIPLVLHVDGQGTIPESDPIKFEHLLSELDGYSIDENSLSFRLGNVINTYNVFQHFFPYFDVLKVVWVKELEKAMLKSFKDSTKKEHVETLRKLTAPLKDGHMSVTARGVNEGNYLPPISWEWIDEKLVVTNVWEDNIALKKGDEISKINGVDSRKYFNEVESMISAGTKGWLQHKSEELALRGKKDSKITIDVNGGRLELVRNMEPYSHPKTFNPYEQIRKGIHYLNLSSIDMETFNYLLPELKKSSGIIFDLRGYPNGNGEIINHLMKSKDTAKAWLNIPKIVYPDRQKIGSYVYGNWNSIIKPQQPYFGDKNIVFITDGSAISYSESLMGFVKGYHLATIVGQPTAGTNGNFNTFILPGKIEIKWTGMKVVKLDGSQLYGIGILPDVYVEKTIEGLIGERDEFLVKAIELVTEE